MWRFKTHGNTRISNDGRRGSVLVNSLESLGFLPVFKACHRIVSVPEDNDESEPAALGTKRGGMIWV